MMKTVNSRKEFSGKNYKLKNGIIKFKTYDNMFNISNGFSLLNKNCRQEQKICIGLNDSNHSFNDLLSHTKLSRWYNKRVIKLILN